MNEKKGSKKGQRGEEITVKRSGYALTQVISVRGERENSTGRIKSIAELIREAIDCCYDVEAEGEELET